MIWDLLKKNSFYIFLLFGITLLIFYPLFQTFYQQDEWQTLAHNLTGSSRFIFQTNNPLQFLFNELRPFSQLMYMLLLGYFKFTVVPAFIISILLHFLNASLLFYLASYLTKNKLIAFLAGTFLIVNSVSHQAVTWISAVSTLPAVTLILLSLISNFWYLDNKRKKFLYLSFLFAILSLYFKGVGLFLFILLPTLPFIYKRFPFNSENVRFVLKENLLLLLFGFLMLGVRFSAFFFRSEKIVGYAGGGGDGFILPVVLRSILYPLTSFFQIFIPTYDLYAFSSILTRMQYKFLVGSPVVDLVAQSVTADLIAIFGSFVILGFFIYFLKITKDSSIQKNLTFALLFFFLCFLPYIALDRDSSYLSSRYFYVGLIPAGLIFGYFMFLLSERFKKIRLLIIGLAFLYLMHHALIVRSDISNQVRIASERKTVLEGIRNLHPDISNNTIFYVTSDRKYYGEITNPFQNGLGYVLEVWYFDTGKIPSSFLSENFLWDLGAEGYKKEGQKSFGYFQDISKLDKLLMEHNISPDTVYGYMIRGSDAKVLDITEETRKILSTRSASLE